MLGTGVPLEPELFAQMSGRPLHVVEVQLGCAEEMFDGVPNSSVAWTKALKQVRRNSDQMLVENRLSLSLFETRTVQKIEEKEFRTVVLICKDTGKNFEGERRALSFIFLETERNVGSCVTMKTDQISFACLANAKIDQNSFPNTHRCSFCRPAFVYYFYGWLNHFYRQNHGKKRSE